jgi:membrane protease YdiL (CAAX protease family)
MSYGELHPVQDPVQAPPERVDPVLPPPFGRATRLGGVYALFLLMIAGMLVIGGAMQFLAGFVINALVTEITVIFLPIVSLLRKIQPWKQLKLDRAPAAESLLMGVMGVMGLAIMLAQFGVWMEMVFPMPEMFKRAYIEAITADSIPELLLFVFAAGLVAGIAEEVAFRGYFQQIFESRYGAHGGVFMAAALFAMMHLDPWHVVALFVIGVYLGYLFQWTGNLWIPAAAHFANNAASVILIYAMPSSSLSKLDEPPPMGALVAGVIVFTLAVMRLRRIGLARLGALSA